MTDDQNMESMQITSEEAEQAGTSTVVPGRSVEVRVRQREDSARYRKT